MSAPDDTRLGIGTFAELKAHLLNPALIANTDYDDRITQLGRFMAGRFGKYCNRIFDYAVDAEFECTANRAYVILPRYPLNGTPTIELSTGTPDPEWQELTGVIQSQSSSAGIIEFLAYQGPFFTRLLITFTGGYWYPADDEDWDDLPTGATERPADLLYAWLLQCEEVWKKRDVLGLNLADTTEKKVLRTLQDLEFVPDVKAILDSYVRQNING